MCHFPAPFSCQRARYTGSLPSRRIISAPYYFFAAAFLAGAFLAVAFFVADFFAAAFFGAAFASAFGAAFFAAAFFGAASAASAFGAAFLRREQTLASAPCHLRQSL
jgi:hypothetical protein